jgi:hypothetical protein
VAAAVSVIPHVILKTWLLYVLVSDRNISVIIAIHMIALQPTYTHRTQHSHLPRNAYITRL